MGTNPFSQVPYVAENPPRRLSIEAAFEYLEFLNVYNIQMTIERFHSERLTNEQLRY